MPQADNYPYYITIYAGNLAAHPFYVMIYADKEDTAIRLALEKLRFSGSDFDVDDQIVVSRRIMPVEGDHRECNYYFVWEFLPEVDPTARSVIRDN